MAVVITGMGVQSPLGCSFEESLQQLGRGVPCVDDIQNFDTSGFSMKAAGEIRHDGSVVKTPAHIDRKILFLDRALEELRLTTGYDQRYLPHERVMNMGCGVDHVDIEALFASGEYLLPPFAHFGSHHKTAAQMRNLATQYDVLGGCHLFVSACVASTQAIGLSFRMLRHGLNRAILTGGSESMISHINYMGFYLLGAMASGYASPVACKPFDKHRNGTVLGEGAIALLLENSSRAPKERILAEICGYGSTADAYSVTDPDPSAQMLALAIEMALKDAGIGPELIDCVHLHGTGTPKNDPAEYRALQRVFGERVSKLPVFSMKGQIGHLIASCGAMELLGVIHSIQNQVVLPTVNFSEPDPETPFFVVKDKPLSLPIRYVLKLNSAFGGENTALVLKKYEG